MTIIFSVLLFCTTVAYALLFAIRPNGPYYISSKFSTETFFWSFPIFFIFELYSKFLVMGKSAICFLYIQLYAMLIHHAFGMQRHNKSLCTTAESSKKLIKAASLHQKLFILNNHFNESMLAIWPSFIIFGFGSFLVIGYFGCIRFPTKLSILEYLTFPTITIDVSIVLTLLFVLLSNVHTKSTKNAAQLIRLSGKKNKYTRKICSRLNAFGVKIMPLKMVRSYYMFHFYNFIFSLIISVLIQFP